MYVVALLKRRQILVIHPICSCLQGRKKALMRMGAAAAEAEKPDDGLLELQ
jgi:hypothetical protein